MTDHIAPAGISKTTTIQPPPGVTINFDGPNPLGTTAITVTSVFMVLAFLFAGIRAYTKIKIYRRGSWDDVTCALGLFSTLLDWIIFLLQVINEGYGRHLWDVPLTVTTSDTALTLSYLGRWTAIITYIFIKLTFFILYYNIFKPFRWLKISIAGGAVVVTSVYVAFTVAELISATPGADQTWLEALSNARGSVRIDISIPISAWTLASDIFILLLPICGVVRLQISSKKKVGLLIIFMAGLGAVVCSCLSFYYRTLLDQDLSYSVAGIQTLVIVELCVGICITCLPSILVFIRHILPSVKSLRSQFPPLSNLRGSWSLRQGYASHGDNIHQDRAIIRSGPYQNLDDRRLEVKESRAYDLPLYPAQAVKMEVVAEPYGDISDDRIHLRVDLEQG